jgi:hypothetical protein
MHKTGLDSEAPHIRALLHLSYSFAMPFGSATLVTQDPSRTSVASSVDNALVIFGEKCLTAAASSIALMGGYESAHAKRRGWRARGILNKQGNSKFRTPEKGGMTPSRAERKQSR